MIVIRIVFKILLLVYKALNGTVPSYISELFKYHTSERKLRSSSQHLVTPKAGMKTYRERERLLWRHQDYGTQSHLN